MARVLVIVANVSPQRTTSENKKAKRGEVHLVPEHINPYQRVYICTHGWKNRVYRGTGHPQHIRLADCSFRFLVQACPKDTCKLQVKDDNFVHSHDITVENYAGLPSSRDLNDARVEARVEGMLSIGAKRSKIYDYLLEHDQHVIQSAVDNSATITSSLVR
ncbi:hypothetical protein PHMEG_00021148 [Phytophthora megakarya]|uniref:Uncharacterized protein n=1 Tax=Phytophthora megakarya TaxID=4795 RepID=A0A225VM30_9STRA|nr:hypothetical protein PHMEG_00021148 [Phytophthora megakarya]